MKKLRLLLTEYCKNLFKGVIIMSEKFKVHFHKCVNCGKYSNNSYCVGKCGTKTERVEFEIKNNWSNLHIGNIVEWNNDLWIVSSIRKESVLLINFYHENVIASPNINWPYDPTHRVNSIQYISSCAWEFFKHQ